MIILRERDQEQTAKRRQRVAKATRRERKTSGYLGLESHFHADDRVRIYNNNNNNNTYIALIRMRSKRFTSIVLQYDLEI